jgi:XTP/dITP diphosphohydrolase
VPRVPDISRCVFASGNPGKLREMREILASAGITDITIVAQSELGIEGAEETGETFAENAMLKARHAARQSGLPAIADDSGLVVDALGGRPGVHSARFAGEGASDTQNIARLLEALRGVPEEERQAHFHCTAVLLAPGNEFQPVIAEGDWPGLILLSPAGTGGFGYDPVFFDPVAGKAAAQMSTQQKNTVSHRGKALRRLAAALQP